ncbi:MAG: ubiquinol-cytochrome c reductase iron-sulfur subunit [Gemmataceae bacterium]|nr:ubiquinol-cytochrome c reductase iron-sulfur subunit [Gemmataceae bacterium]MDW8264956.1 ubiquinol-cytochrome c reductase iron-sulfur subunit [Gemmataceae bacterium]
MSEPAVPSRRSFFELVTMALGGIASAALAVPFIGYLLGAIRKNPRRWLSLGPVGQFPLGETRLHPFTNPIRQPWDGMTAETGVYVRNLGGGDFLVFAMNCTHLGCPVTWFPQSGLFMCPCHGGVYYENGERASGPPPRGLFRCVWEVRDGQLWIQAPFYPTLQNSPENPAPP